MKARYQIFVGYIGQLWSALLSIAFIPSFANILGIKLYGVIGIYITAQALFSILDVGITNTLIREISRLRHLNDYRGIGNILRTNEIAAFLIGPLALVSTLVPFMAVLSDFSNESGLSFAESWGIYLIAICLIALRPVESIYKQSLIGFEKILAFNLVLVITNTVKWVGTFLVIKLISPTIQAYFASQLIAALLSVALSGFAVYWFLEKGRCISKSIPSLTLFLKHSGFNASITAIMALTTLLMQTDRITLPINLSLEEFGYYSFAASLAAGVFYLITPISSSVYPRLCFLYETRDKQALVKLFFGSTQLVIVIIAPIVFVLCAYGGPLIAIWSGSESLASNTSALFAILLLGNFFCCLSYIPTQLQYSHGRTLPWLKVLIVEILIYLPAAFFLAPILKAPGIAMIWLLLNVIVVLIAVPITLQPLKFVNVRRWFVYSLAIPVAFALAPVVLFNYWVSSVFQELSLALHPLQLTFVISISLAGALISSFLVSSELRPRLVTLLSRTLPTNES